MGRGNPDSEVHGANMGPISNRQDPGGPHVGPMKFAIWEVNLRLHVGAQCASIVVLCRDI